MKTDPSPARLSEETLAAWLTLTASKGAPEYHFSIKGAELRALVTELQAHRARETDGMISLLASVTYHGRMVPPTGPYVLVSDLHKRAGFPAPPAERQP